MAPAEWISIRNRLLNIARHRQFTAPFLNNSAALTSSTCVRTKNKLIKLKQHLITLNEAHELSFTNQQIEHFTDLRCTNFHKKQKKFISSALE